MNCGFWYLFSVIEAITQICKHCMQMSETILSTCWNLVQIVGLLFFLKHALAVLMRDDRRLVPQGRVHARARSPTRTQRLRQVINEQGVVIYEHELLIDRQYRQIDNQDLAVGQLRAIIGVKNQIIAKQDLVIAAQDLVIGGNRRPDQRSQPQALRRSVRIAAAQNSGGVQ